MASSTSASSQSKLLGLAAVVFTLLVTVQGQQPNNAGGGPQNAGPMGGGLNPPFQVPPGQPNPPQQPRGAGFRRRVPMPRAGLEGTVGPQGPGGPRGPHIPPELLARRMAFIQAAAARARALQEAAVTADAEGDPRPNIYERRGKPRSGLDRGRPIDVPTGMPQFPHPQGIPARQGGSGNAMHSGEK
uniref:Uncharacterized protein n=1 Tax=Rhipicephalus appendiculatus TaxID=34631 RepID=A0A131YFP8_RHIAP